MDENMRLVKIGARIRGLRKKQGMTQAELGEAVGLQRSGIAKYENGRFKSITIERLDLFAEVLGADLLDLLIGTNPSENKSKGGSTPHERAENL